MIHVEGVSCLGRCDRAPAACVSVTGSEHDCFYLKRSAAELKQIAQDWLRGEARPADRDIDQPFSPAPITIDPYAGKSPEYAAVMRAIQIRDEALVRAANLLSEKFDWPQDDIARFRNGAPANQIRRCVARAGRRSVALLAYGRRLGQRT